MQQWQVTDPHGWYARLREQAPVARVVLPSGLVVWVVTRYADARQVLSDPRFAKNFHANGHVLENNAAVPGAGAVLLSSLFRNMLFSDPPDHARLRRMVSQVFTPHRVAALRPRVEEISMGLLDEVDASSESGLVEFDLIDRYAFPLPIAVISELLGLPEFDRDRVRHWSSTIMMAAVLDRQTVALAVREMTDYLTSVIADKRVRPGEDLLSALIQMHEDGDRLSADELLGMVFLMITAGHETTVNLIGNGVLALLTQPDQLALLRANLTLIPSAVEELLRFDGPVSVATHRFTTEAVQVGEVTIPEGQIVTVSLLSANRDPQRFTDPDRLDATRPTSGHLAFGHGIHYCLGAPLARAEGEIALRHLLHRYPDLRLAVPEDQLDWRPTTLMRGLNQLPLAAGSLNAKVE